MTDEYNPNIQDDYTRWLRSKIGHTPIVMPVAGMVILNRQNEILLERRSDDDTWVPPAGIIEPHETIEQAAIREVYEETSLRVAQKDMKLLNIYSGDEHFHRWPNGDEAYHIRIVFITHRAKGDPRPNVESKELKYFPLDEIPETVPYITHCVVEDTLKRLTKKR